MSHKFSEAQWKSVLSVFAVPKGEKREVYYGVQLTRRKADGKWEVRIQYSYSDSKHYINSQPKNFASLEEAVVAVTILGERATHNKDVVDLSSLLAVESEPTDTSPQSIVTPAESIAKLATEDTVKKVSPFTKAREKRESMIPQDEEN